MCYNGKGKGAPLTSLRVHKSKETEVTHLAKILDGKQVVEALNERIKAEVDSLKGQGISPDLAIIRIGEREDDIAYERGAIRRLESLGIDVDTYRLAADISQEELLAIIEEINNDSEIHGCLLLRPLPKHIDDNVVRNALLPAKDIDGITDASLAGVFTGIATGFPPCTPQACMEILDHFDIEVSGKKAVVVGRSLVVGKPVAMMLLQKNATVTICHTRTQDMPAVCREGEILIVAAGRAGIVGADYLSPGQVVIDVGINMGEDGKLKGDVDFAAAEAVVAAITPVPGGVGTVTTSVLAKHVVEAAKRQSM